MGVFITRAPARSPLVKYFDIPIADTTTEIVDSIPFSGRISAKWLVTAVNPSKDEKETYEVVGTYLNGAATPYYTVYARTGDKIKNKAEVVLDSGNLALQVTNSEGSDIIVDVLRFELSA